MTEDRFDLLVQAVTTTISRRRDVVAFLGGLLATALPALELDAQRRHRTRDQGKNGRPKHRQRSDQSRRVVPSPGDGRLTGQIANGTTVPQGKYPFAVSIRTTRSDGTGSLCTGSLISPAHVLTAAHCTFDNVARAFFPVSAFTVVVGQVNRLDTSCAACRKRVTATAVDPSWVPGTQFIVPHDVAVLTLDTPVPASIAQPITLIASGDGSREAVGQEAVAAGWGITTTDGNASTVLMEAPLPVAACSRAEPTQLCTGVVAGRATCSGDSGAPLFVVVPSAAASGKQPVQAAKKKKKKKHHHPPPLPPDPPPPPPPPPSPCPGGTPCSLVQIGVVNGGPAGCPSADGTTDVYGRLSDPAINSFVRNAMATV